MYNEDCIYFKENDAGGGFVGVCTCGVRHDYMKFTSIEEDFFPDCTNCKYYCSIEKVRKRLEEVLK